MKCLNIAIPKMETGKTSKETVFVNCVRTKDNKLIICDSDM